MKTLYLKLLFRLVFKKIPKKQYGRCVTCDANQICYKLKVCKCNDEQQYESIFKKL